MSEEENSSGVPSLGHGLEYDLWEGQFQFVGIDGADDDDDDDVVGGSGRSGIINGSGDIDVGGIVINNTSGRGNRVRSRRRTVIRIGDANEEEQQQQQQHEEDGVVLDGDDHHDDDDDDDYFDDDEIVEYDGESGRLVDIFTDRNGNNKSATTIGEKQQLQLQQFNGVVKARKKKAWSTDLNEKVQVLQEQMSVLTDNQNHSDERYTRAKQENAALQARVIILEEQLREVELRAQEKLQDEERRHRELVVRVDREKQLQVENCAIRLQSLELENSSLRAEAARCRAQAEKLRAEVQRLEEEQGRNEATIAALKEELETLREKERWNSETSQANQQLIEELTQEIERLRAEQRETLEQLNSRGNGVSPTAHEQLQAKFSQLREDNRRLQEAHDELQALLLTKSVEEGRSLLTEHQSLAAELEAMSQDEPAPASTDDLEVRTALKEQQEVNAQLRSYIDGILLNIVDNYPQLLEVKGGLP